VSGDVAEDNVPRPLRDTLSLESLLNDGLAYLFVFLPAAFLSASVEQPWMHWLVHDLLRGVGLALLLGVSAGWIAGALLAHARARNFLRPPAFLAYSLALSLLVVGAMRLLDTDSILAVAVAGLVFALRASDEVRGRHQEVQEALNHLITLPVFLLLGAVLPLEQWHALGWGGLAFGLALLVLRRPFIVRLLARRISTFEGRREAWFAGWFGPIGISALYYATLLRDHEYGEQLWGLTTLAVTLSVFAHGATAAPFSRWLGRSRSH